MGNDEYTILFVPITDLRPHPANEKYKTPLDDVADEYRLMKASIEVDGLRNPLLVQAGTNVIISGHTRYRIVSQLGWTEVPVRYLEVDDESAELMLVQDNVERSGKEKDLMRLARSIELLYSRYSSRKEAYSQLTDIFGVGDRQLDRLRTLSNLIPPLQKLVSEERIGLKAGTALAALNEEDQNAAVQYIFDSGLSSQKEWRFTEKYADEFIKKLRLKHLKTLAVDEPVPAQHVENVDQVEKDLQNNNGFELLGEETPASEAEHRKADRRNIRVEHLDPPDHEEITEQEERNAKNEHAIYMAVKLVTRDIRALERMQSQTLPAVELALQLGSSEVKIEVSQLKKNLHELVSAL